MVTRYWKTLEAVNLRGMRNVKSVMRFAIHRSNPIFRSHVYLPYSIFSHIDILYPWDKIHISFLRFLKMTFNSILS